MTSGDDVAGEPPARGRYQDFGETAVGPGRVVSRGSQEGVQVLALSGELDLDSVQEVLPLLDETLAAHPDRLVIDLSAVGFADSSAVNMLLRTHGRTSLHVSGPLHPFVARLFEVMGISGVLNVHPTLDDAVRAARGR